MFNPFPNVRTFMLQQVVLLGIMIFSAMLMLYAIKQKLPERFQDLNDRETASLNAGVMFGVILTGMFMIAHNFVMILAFIWCTKTTTTTYEETTIRDGARKKDE